MGILVLFSFAKTSAVIFSQLYDMDRDWGRKSYLVHIPLSENSCECWHMPA